MKKNKLTLSLILIVILLAILAFVIWREGSGLALSTADLSYHMAAASGYARAGGMTTWDFWESLPLGRPQNYPPLFHLILATLLKFGITNVVAAKIMGEICLIGGFIVFNYGLSKLFNIRVAFWSTFFLILSLEFIKISDTIMPASIVVFLVPLLFYSFQKEKWITYITVLIFMFYLHLFLPLIILFSLAIYILIFERLKFLRTLKYTAIAYVFFLPWLIHIVFGDWQYIKYFNNFDVFRYRAVTDYNIVVIALACISIIYLFKSKIPKQSYFFFILSLIFIEMAIFATVRTVNGHLLVFLSIFAALLIDYLTKKNSKFIPVVFLLSAVYFFVTPNLYLFGGFWTKSLFLKSIEENISPDKQFELKYDKLFSDVKANSNPGEPIGTAILYFDDFYIDPLEYQSNISNLVAGNSNRPSINLYQPEYNFRPLPDLTKARIILTNKDAREDLEEYLAKFGYKEDQSKQIAQEMKKYKLVDRYKTVNNNDVYLYRNNSDSIIKEKLPSRVFPLWLADILVILGISLVILDCSKEKFGLRIKSLLNSKENNKI